MYIYIYVCLGEDSLRSREGGDFADDFNFFPTSTDSLSQSISSERSLTISDPSPIDDLATVYHRPPASGPSAQLSAHSAHSAVHSPLNSAKQPHQHQTHLNISYSRASSYASNHNRVNHINSPNRLSNLTPQRHSSLDRSGSFDRTGSITRPLSTTGSMAGPGSMRGIGEHGGYQDQLHRQSGLSQSGHSTTLGLGISRSQANLERNSSVDLTGSGHSHIGSSWRAGQGY